MYRDIKETYYGVITEVYKSYGKNLFYYDVNSLYPFVAYNPMPKLQCFREEYHMGDVNLKDLFGFYYCEISCDGLYLGLKPLRKDSGNIYSEGEWKGWYFSEELKFAVDKVHLIL